MSSWYISTRAGSIGFIFTSQPRSYIYKSAEKVPDRSLVFHFGNLCLTSLLFGIIENDILGMVVQEQAARHILFRYTDN